MGLAHQQAPFNVPHCIARCMKEQNEGSKRTVQDQVIHGSRDASNFLQMALVLQLYILESKHFFLLSVA